MPIITEGDITYWMPEVLPEATEEYNQLQSKKIYLTQEGKERLHPGWTYAENGTYVDDEYVFQNEGWKVIIDDGNPVGSETAGILEGISSLKHASRNTPDQWQVVDEKTLKVTYTITDFTQEEIDNHTNAKWNLLRIKRDEKLSSTDWIIVRANEQNLTLSNEIINYRQQLRDFPDTIQNILEIDLGDDSMWPIKPEVYFEV